VKSKTIELRSGDSVIVEGNVEHQTPALEDLEVLTYLLLTAKTMRNDSADGVPLAYPLLVVLE
jgi:quercetin dioxygenase-like cupin family protein